ncbi:hypothetical protein EVAR_47_1 [Eumeta japonica]|uniref:Uncharacterized protein n=1 Tax=Eumeta variegata TaxID=151549 RepID=A0A4C1SBD0_EUMVA|nr:hypothetical protein EVAR_47_1 [Eumeta japonica]
MRAQRTLSKDAEDRWFVRGRGEGGEGERGYRRGRRAAARGRRGGRDKVAGERSRRGRPRLAPSQLASEISTAGWTGHEVKMLIAHGFDEMVGWFDK